MMDHDQLPKGTLPDTLKAEDIPDRYLLKAPPAGEVIGSFNSFQLGLVWKLPNVEETDMLKPIAPDRFVEEKIFYEQNFKQHAKVGLPMKLALYKVSNSPDLHLRAVYSDEGDDTDEGEGDGLAFLKSKRQVLGASVVNESGKALLDEKHALGYMFVGERFWEIPSIIPAKEFGISGLLSADGSLLLRITFGNKEDLPPAHFAVTQAEQVAAPEAPPVPGSTSKEAMKKECGNENLVDEDSNLPASTSSIDVATVGLDPIPFHLTTFAKAGKFTDGVVHVVDQQTGETIDFQVHRVVLAARSSYFETEFEASPRIKIDKYTIPCMKIALDYMYSNQVDCKDFNLLTKLIPVAEDLRISGLKSKCLNGLVDCPIEIPQAMTTFKLGIKYNSVVLRVHAHDFLIKLKGKIGAHTEDFKAFMEETDSKVLFDWLIR